MLQEIRAEIILGVFLMAILFYQLQQADMKTVINVLLFTLWGAAFWYYLQTIQKQKQETSLSKEKILDEENKDLLKHPEIQSNVYSIKAAPKKGLIYLKENKVLMDLAQDVVFVKTFDRQKYQELLVYLNQYQKIYMYVLAERYPCQSYVPTFLDVRESILEILYQCYLVVPSQFKHIYGFDPYQVLEKNIHLFLKLSRTMIEVLENFCRMDLKEYYFPMTQPMPLDASRQTEKQNLMP